MPGELLAVSKELEQKSKELTQEEVHATKEINDFLEKNKTTDEKEIADIKAKYGELLKDVTFSEAYTKEEYEIHKQKIIEYLDINQGHLDQDKIQGWSWDILDPILLEAKIFDYNTTPEGKNKINEAKFMTNFKAEKIGTISFVETYKERNLKTDSQVKQDAIGKIIKLKPEEENSMKNKVDQAINDPSLNLYILGQADGSEVPNTNTIKPIYSHLRQIILKGFPDNDPIRKNLEVIFPEFNQENFKDKQTWNNAFAMTRAMRILASLDQDKLTKIFAGGELKENREKNTYSLGKVTFIFNTVTAVGNEYTKGTIELVPTSESLTESFAKYINQELLNVDQYGFTLSIDYQGKKVGNTAAVGGSPVKRAIAEGFGSYQFINILNNTKEVGNNKLFKNDNISSPENAIVEKFTNKILNIVIPYDQIQKYEKYLNIQGMEIMKPNVAGLAPQPNISLKPMTFRDALDLFKEINKDDHDALNYADKVEAALDNYVQMNEYIKTNPEIKTGIAQKIFEIRKITSDEDIQNSKYAQFLKQLGGEISRTEKGRVMLKINNTIVIK